MTGGGHFAGANICFHFRNVGTAQGLRDSQNRSHAPKSAGASLRRYNEAALVKDIQDTLVSWTDHLKEASAIFVRAPSYNKSMFFGGRTAALDKKDPRVRSIPFATRRATFREVQRVHEVLGDVQIYGELKCIPSGFPESAEEDENGAIKLEMEELSITTLDLREFEVYPAKRKRRKKKKKDETKMQTEGNCVALSPMNTCAIYYGLDFFSVMCSGMVDDTWEYSMRDALFTACKIGDVDGLQQLLGQSADVKSPLIFLNKPIDSSGFTLLHVASAAAQKAVVKCLLDIGADPACRYVCETNTRNVFRKYMGTTLINMTTVKQRPKEEKRKQEMETEEKKRFAALSDRDKRALAAERRMAEQAAATGVSISNVKRCWTCGESLLGKIPFHYLEFHSAVLNVSNSTEKPMPKPSEP
uniref:Ankyrin repeat and zinc finger peptidyl tRNA hydrolase 1 n=1 Tax=Neogobius melanostomus TaxID=47308 RepID=A0A8C6UXQ3_9GOBI